MRHLKRPPVIIALIVVLLAGSEWAVRLFDPATADERAILDDFVMTVQELDCVPARTSGLNEPLRDRRWLEADEAEAVRIEAAYRRAIGRDTRLTTDRGWIRPVLATLVGLPNCSRDVRIGTPAFWGDYAFVTAATELGVNISAYRRGPNGWSWTSMAGDGDSIIQY